MFRSVPVEVSPVFVIGLNGKRAQYRAIDCDILRLVSGVWCFPVFAAAILSFWSCCISLRQIRFIVLLVYCVIVPLVLIIITTHKINIVHFGKNRDGVQNFRVYLLGGVSVPPVPVGL